MVEELKAEMRQLKNMIGFQGRVDVTSRAFTLELIRALDAKYKSDVESSFRLHRLEFYRDLIESARHKQKKSVAVKKKLIPEKKDEKEDEDEESKAPVKEIELFKKPKNEVSINAGNIDEWKDLMTMSRIYYVLEHPNSMGITWKRRISKKKSISKFSDRDLIEWRVGENFKLRGLEDWALSRSEARKLAEKSSYAMDDSSGDDESRKLEDMFNILDTPKQKKRKVGKLEKPFKSNRPFKFKDESIEDWTESYSDDSEESGAEDMVEEILEIDEVPDLKIDEYKVSSEKPSINEEETISDLFAVYEEREKYRNPIFEELDETETMEQWFDMCHKAVGVPKAAAVQRPPSIPQFTFTTDDDEEKYLETEILDNEIPVKEVEEKDLERPGERFIITEAKEEDIEPKRDFEDRRSDEESFDDIEGLGEIELSEPEEEYGGTYYSTDYHVPFEITKKKSSEESSEHSSEIKSTDLPKDSVTTSDQGTISKDVEEDIEDKIGNIMKEGKKYAKSDVEKEAADAPAGGKLQTPSESQATVKKSVTSFERQLAEETSGTSLGTQDDKKKIPASSETLAAQEKSATSSKKQAIATASELRPLKMKSATSFEEDLKKSDASSKKSKSKFEKRLRSESGKKEIKNLLQHLVEDAKVDVLEEQNKGYKSPETSSPDPAITESENLESILKSESILKMSKSGNVKNKDNTKG